MFDPRKGLDVMHTIMGAFASFILYPVIRPFVVLLFGITTTLSLTMMFRLQIGLEQTLALPKVSSDEGFTWIIMTFPLHLLSPSSLSLSFPSPPPPPLSLSPLPPPLSPFPQDSYLENYYSDLFGYLHTGSPVYFVIKEGFNYSDPNFQKKFCSAAGCDKESIGTSIFAYSRNADL